MDDDRGCPCGAAGYHDIDQCDREKLLGVIRQLQMLHDQWGATGNHFEAFRALRTILNGVGYG
jgi:hypothetical protein